MSESDFVTFMGRGMTIGIRFIPLYFTICSWYIDMLEDIIKSTHRGSWIIYLLTRSFKSLTSFWYMQTALNIHWNLPCVRYYNFHASCSSLLHFLVGCVFSLLIYFGLLKQLFWYGQKPWYYNIVSIL